MKLRFLVVSSFLGLILIAMPSVGQERRRSEFEIPDGQMVVVERADDPKSGSYAIFRGKVTLKGLLAIEFDRRPGGEEPRDTDPELFFVPDPSELQKLPHAVGTFDAAWPLHIDLQGDAKELLRKGIGNTASALIVAGDMPHYEFPAEIVITEMRTDVECGHRSFGAMNFELKILPKTVAKGPHALFIGC